MAIRELTDRKGGNVRIRETRNQNALTDVIPRRRHRAPISDMYDIAIDLWCPPQPRRRGRNVENKLLQARGRDIFFWCRYTNREAEVHLAAPRIKEKIKGLCSLLD